NLNYTWEMSTWLSFFINLHHYTGITFPGGPFTDKLPIFIDVSVNDNDFAKCSAAHHLLNRCT
ncbi:hypothetical protein ABHA99_07450, partial [Ligilactobacillus ruminis]